MRSERHLMKLAARIGLIAPRDDREEEALRQLRALTPLADDVVRRAAPYIRARARGGKHALRKLGMALEFDSPEAAQKHQAIRSPLAAMGGLAGAAAGARAGMKRGVGGMLAGGVLGGLAGHTGAGVAFDAAHDIPQRTIGGYDATQQRLHAAGGMPAIKFATGEFSATGDEFEAFVVRDHAQDRSLHNLSAQQSVYEHDQKRREQAPPWGAATGPMPDGALAATLPSPSAV